jgi:hypothetical protein
MKAMVTNNIETDLDVANGARGEIVDIILHPDEPALGNEPIMKLTKLPAYILIKMERTRATTLEGLEENVIPVDDSIQDQSRNISRKNRFTYSSSPPVSNDTSIRIHGLSIIDRKGRRYIMS